MQRKYFGLQMCTNQATEKADSWIVIGSQSWCVDFSMLSSYVMNSNVHSSIHTSLVQ